MCEWLMFGRAVLDTKCRAESSLFSSMMKQEPISGVVSNGHLSGYNGCDVTSMMASMPEKSYLVDDRGLLNGSVFSSGGAPVGMHHPQLNRVNGLRVNYANRGGTIRSYHCRLCRKVHIA